MKKPTNKAKLPAYLKTLNDKQLDRWLDLLIKVNEDSELITAIAQEIGDRVVEAHPLSL